MNHLLLSPNYPDSLEKWGTFQRKGAYLFDSPSFFSEILQHCWKDFLTSYQLATKVPKHPIPRLFILIPEAIYTRKDFGVFDKTVHTLFHPFLQGQELSYEWKISSETGNQAEFFFQISSEAFQKTKCTFLVGQEIVSSAHLGEVSLFQDHKEFSIQRKLGLTFGSQIQKAFLDSTLYSRFSKQVQNDLKYIGFGFSFSFQQDEYQITISNIDENASFEGGLFLLEEGQTIHFNQRISFYERYDTGNQDESSYLSFVLHAEETILQPPWIEEIVFWEHSSRQTEQPFWEILVKCQSKPQGKWQLQNADNTISLEDLDYNAQNRLYSKRLTDLKFLAEKQNSFFLASGKNSFGLEFQSSKKIPFVVKKAWIPVFKGKHFVSRKSLLSEWKIEIELDSFDVVSDKIEMNEWFCWIQLDQEPPFSIFLNSSQKNNLLFKYFFKMALKYLNTKCFESAQTIQLWIERKELHSSEIPMTLLSTNQNSEEHPLVSIQIVDFEGEFIPFSDRKPAFLPQMVEFFVPPCLFQYVDSLTTSNHKGKIEKKSLLLLEPSVERSLEIQKHKKNFFHIQKSKQANQTTESFYVDSIWFSNTSTNRLIDVPTTKDPNGGKAFVWALGSGSYQELAQLKIMDDEIYLFQSREHVEVTLDGETIAIHPTTEKKERILSFERSPIHWLQVGCHLFWIERKSDKDSFQIQQVGFVQSFQKGESHWNISSQPQLEKENTLSVVIPSSHSFEFSIHSKQLHSDNWLQNLVLMDTVFNQPSEVIFGRIFEQNEVQIAFWKTKWLETKGLFAEITSWKGRYRFSLSTSFGKLGFWSEGSAFSSSFGHRKPLFPSSEERIALDGSLVPEHTILVGTEISTSDVLLPSFSDQPPSNWFGLRCFGEKMELLPLSFPLHRVFETKKQSGELFWKWEKISSKSFSVEWDADGSFVFTCFSFLFELSLSKGKKEIEWDLHPNTDVVLSLKGRFFPPGTDVWVGGNKKTDGLPLSKPSFSQEPYLFHLFEKESELQWKGDSIAGILQQNKEKDLFQRLQEKCSTHASLFGLQSNLWNSILRHNHSVTTVGENWFQNPTCLHETDSMPPLFLLEKHLFPKKGLELVYHLRTREDGFPLPDRAPAKLLFEPKKPTLSLQWNKEKNVLLWNDLELHEIWIGRSDSPSENETLQTLDTSEISFSTWVDSEKKNIGKIGFDGYSPRKACQLSIQDSKPLLKVPKPGSAGGYHLVVDGTPIYEESNFELVSCLTFHINHLVLCEIQKEADNIHFCLLGFLVGHQVKPSLAVEISQENKMGHIAISGLEEHWQLVPHVFPPCFQSQKQEKPSLWIEEASFSPLALANIELLQNKNPFFHQPSGMDRLLWFLENRQSKDSIVFANQPKDWNFNDEGSSFAFFEVPPQPVEKNVPKETIELGFFKEEFHPENLRKFGFFGFKTDLYCQCIETSEGILFQVPHSLSQTSTMGVFRKGKFWEIQSSILLEENDVLKVGLAGFLFQKNNQQFQIQRKWLWLPKNENILLSGNGFECQNENHLFVSGWDRERMIHLFPRQRGHVLIKNES